MVSHIQHSFGAKGAAVSMPLDRRAPVQAVRPRTASLSLYDPPALREAADSFWSGVAGRLAAVGVEGIPKTLSHAPPGEAQWRNPDLLLAQAGSYELMTHLNGRVKLVATPRYRARGCDGPFQRGAVLVRRGDAATSLGDLRGRRCAVSDLDADGGMNLLRAETAALAKGEAFFQSVALTGSQAGGAERVAAGEADVTAVDALTYDHLERFQPELAGALRLLMWTVRAPGPPLVTAAATDLATREALQLALRLAAEDPAQREAMNELRLDGFNVLPLSHYRAVLYLEQIAVDQGYPRLA